MVCTSVHPLKRMDDVGWDPRKAAVRHRRGSEYHRLTRIAKDHKEERLGVTSRNMKFATFVLKLAKFALSGVFGLVALGAVLVTAVGVLMEIPVPPETEITNRKPFVDYIGREYRVLENVSAYAWNDFPERGQRVRIVSAWRQFALFEIRKRYVVSLPGSGLPENVRITMNVESNGIPDPLVYEPIAK